MAKLSDSATASAVQAYQATFTSHESSAKKNTSPQVSARPNVAGRRFPHTARVSSAGPAMASGQKPTGGNAPASARPAAKAASSDHQPPGPFQPVAWAPLAAPRRDSTAGRCGLLI